MSKPNTPSRDNHGAAAAPLPWRDRLRLALNILRDKPTAHRMTLEGNAVISPETQMTYCTVIGPGSTANVIKDNHLAQRP